MGNDGNNHSLYVSEVVFTIEQGKVLKSRVRIINNPIVIFIISKNLCLAVLTSWKR